MIYFSENISRFTDMQKCVAEVLSLNSVSVIRVRVSMKLVLPKEGGVDVLTLVVGPFSVRVDVCME